MLTDAPKGQLNLDGIDPLQNREFQVRKRDGRVEMFNEERIVLAIEGAFRAEYNLDKTVDLGDKLEATIKKIAEAVMHKAVTLMAHDQELTVERIQDLVETQLMKDGHHAVVRRYILYREERRKSRALRGDKTEEGRPQAQIYVTFPDGTRESLDSQKIRRALMEACRGHEERCHWRELADDAFSSLYDGVRVDEIAKAMISAAKSRIEREPEYAAVAARLLASEIYAEVLPKRDSWQNLEELHRLHFPDAIKQSVAFGRLSDKLLDFNLDKLAEALVLERDEQFSYMGLQTIFDRYLIHEKGRRLETPQYFWMRVSMGLSINEGANKEARAIEFYHVLSSFHFISSTPTLFNAGTLHPQLSSCYLTTVMDDLDHIFKCVSDDAKLSKWAGGLGNDWSNVRATGAHIKGTNGESQGVIPFLKVANDTAVAVNQGGKRKGAMCAYLETWHLDIEDFLELRKNTGDERRRTHDMNTANWIPDLFMKRVKQNGFWTLFNPSDVPDLHDLYGAAFERRYAEYEAKAERGEIKLFKKVEALTIWRKILSMLFETGHPWVTFKDPSNIRSPQDHTGVVHSSNLCTEILLNTSADETAVCNLGSINLVAHIIDGKLNDERLSQTIRTAMRMLDNVIDINYYPTIEARNANLKHRPVGLGLMGFQDALYKLRISYASEAAVQFADRSMELISFYAVLASTELAAERGTYLSYKGSKWDRGLLPIDTIELLEKERGEPVAMDRSASLDWTPVRDAIKKHGMRNSNTMAIAPTATISNIIGVSQSIEPSFKNLFAKGNLSGDFTVINNWLVEDLRSLGLWDEKMLGDLKYMDGSVQEIDRIPLHLREIYRTAFEIDPTWYVECASRRQKWIDMGQSLNLYIAAPNGRKLSDMYIGAWESGLKTTYYLRSTAASTIEKSTLSTRPRWTKKPTAEQEEKLELVARPATEVKACSILDPGCEACQ